MIIKQIFEKIYYDYEEKESGNWNYEMRPLSYELLKANCVYWIDSRFNLLWLYYKALHYPFLLEKKGGSRWFDRTKIKLSLLFPEVTLSIRRQMEKKYIQTALSNSFFLHFAGSANDMSIICKN